MAIFGNSGGVTTLKKKVPIGTLPADAVVAGNTGGNVTAGAPTPKSTFGLYERTGVVGNKNVSSGNIVPVKGAKPLTPVPAKPSPLIPLPGGEGIVEQPPSAAGLADIAAKMKTARDSGDYGTLKTLTDQYNTVQTGLRNQVAPTNDGAVQAQTDAILGVAAGEVQAPVAGTIQERKAKLATLAQQLATAREQGNLQLVGQLTPQYQALVSSIQGEVATGPDIMPGAPGGGPGTGEPGKGQPSAAYPKMTPEIQGKLDALQNQMMNPNLTNAQRENIRKQVGDLTAQAGYVDPRIANPEAGGIAGPGVVPAAGGEGADTTQGIQGTDGKPAVPPAGGEGAAGAPPPINFRDYFTQGLTSGSPQAMDEALAWDENFYNTAMPEGIDPASWNNDVQSEMETYRQELQKYPDQFDKVTRDHRTRMNELKQNLISRDPLTDLFKQVPPELKVKIDALPENLKADFMQDYQEAIDAGKDPKSVIDDYLSFYDPIDFKLKPPGYESKDLVLEGYEKGTAPDITKAGTDTGGIDSALNKLGQTAAGNEALQTALKTFTDLVKSGGAMSDQELKDHLSPFMAEIDAQAAKDVSAAQHDAQAKGLMKGGYDPAAPVRAQALRDKQMMVADIVKQNLTNRQQGILTAGGELTKIAGQEQAGALSEKQLAVGAEENKAQLKLAGESLFQEGKLSVYGTKVQESLQEYGIALEQYQTDKGFDIDRLKLDMEERFKDADLSVEEAKMKADEVTQSIEFAMQETEEKNRWATALADLQLKAAQGDQDAKYKVQALKVQQELTDKGMTTDWAKFLGNLQYGLYSGKLQMDHEMELLLTELAAAEELQGSEWAKLGGQLIGAGGAIATTAILASSETFKTDIETLTPEQEDAVRELILQTETVKFKYKPEIADPGKEHIGVIAERAPGQIVTADGKHIDLGDAFGMLLATVKSQGREIEKLRKQVNRAA